MRYNWQQKDWPNFVYDLSETEPYLVEFEARTAQSSKVFDTLPEKIRHETIFDMMVTEAIKTSEIEGEFISREDVMSSIRNQLGLNLEPAHVRDQRAKGAAQLMLAVRNTFADDLSEAMLLGWHRMLMQSNSRILIGAWRTHAEVMQVVSGLHHKPTIHFEAPPSQQVPDEMQRYIRWFNTEFNKGFDAGFKNSAKNISSAVVRSAVAHVYFESIHPFEDGNGRIGRALSEKVLSQGLNRPILLSLSKAIEAQKKTYYHALESAQQSNDITPWINYFARMTLEAQKDAEMLIDFVLKKTRFYDRYHHQLDAHQLKAVNRMLEQGPTGFEGGMNAKKYSAITRMSKATATRHLQYLKTIGALTQHGSARATRYYVNLDGQ